MNNPIKSREQIDEILDKHDGRPDKPSRDWLIYQALPKMQGGILFVGVNDYTKYYQYIVPNPATFETIDICPERGKAGGSDSKHHVGDLKSLDPRHHCYDHIILFGLHGFKGHNISNESVFDDLQHAHNLLNYYGTLTWAPSPQITVNLNEHKNLPYTEFATIVIDDMKTQLNYETIGRMDNYDNIIWMGTKNPTEKIATPLLVGHSNENHIFEPSRYVNPFKSMLDQELLKKKNKEQ